MRSIRTKKLKIQTNKYLMGPFDDSLIQIQLDKNQKCIQQINKDNFDRASELLKQIKADGEMISSYNRQKYIVKSLSLNTEAYFNQKQKKYEEALKCLQEAERLEEEQKASPIDLARTKLNKSVILSHIGKHQQAISLGKEALQLLKRKREMQFFQLRKNQYKLYEIMTISFYNIASQLSHLSDVNEAEKVYKEGYYLAQKTLGPNHKLTILLRSIVKINNRQLSRSRQKLSLQHIGNNKSEPKLFKNSQTQLVAPSQKQKQLKRIYASKKRSYTNKTKDGASKKQIDYYLKSFDKIKNMYPRNKKTTKNARFYTTNRQSQQTINVNTRKFITESEYSVHRYQDRQHQKIKDIILNGKSFNKNGYYMKDIPQIHSQLNKKQKSKSNSNSNSKPKISTSRVQELVPLHAPKQKQPSSDLTFVDIAKKVQQKNEQNSQACQLI